MSVIHNMIDRGVIIGTLSQLRKAIQEVQQLEEKQNLSGYHSVINDEEGGFAAVRVFPDGSLSAIPY